MTRSVEVLCHSAGPWHTAGTFNPDGPRPTTWVWGPTPEGAQSGECIAQHVALTNAPLICAAPDLLSAARAYLRLLERSVDVGPLTNNPTREGMALARLRSAVSKAERCK